MSLTNPYSNLATNINSIGGGYFRLNAKDGIQGPDIPCRFCRVRVSVGNIFVKIGSAATGEDDGMRLSTTITPYPVDNLNKLFFFSEETSSLDIEYFI